MNRLTPQQPIQIGRAAAVAAQQAMVPQDPQIARLRCRRIGRSGHLIRIAQPIGRDRVQDLRQLVRSEPQQVQIELQPFKIRQFDRQDIEVPLGQRSGLIVGNPVRLDLHRREIGRHMHRHTIEAQLLSRLVPRVTAAAPSSSVAVSAHNQSS